MFIPFAGQWINPAHITRMVYIEGKRLTVFMADGQDGLTEKGAAGDEAFRRFMTTALTFTNKHLSPDDVAALSVPDMPVRQVELHDHNVELSLGGMTPDQVKNLEKRRQELSPKKGRRK